jgi:peptide deformylase
VVKRPSSIHVKALDIDGKLVDRQYTGLLARIIQHEIDHLDGISFVDRVEKQTLRHDQYLEEFEVFIKK